MACFKPHNALPADHCPLCSLALQEPETNSWQFMNSAHQLVVLGNIAKIGRLQSLDWTSVLDWWTDTKIIL